MEILLAEFPVLEKRVNPRTEISHLSFLSKNEINNKFYIIKLR